MVYKTKEKDKKDNDSTPQIFLRNDPDYCSQDQRRIFSDQP